MKNLLGIVSLLAVASLAVLAVASVLGVSSPSWPVVTRIVGFSWAAGVLALFVTDYAPRHTYNVSATVRAAAVPAAVSPRRMVPATARRFAGAATAEAMATLGLTNDPATVSLM
jgi:hypothetical protein